MSSHRLKPFSEESGTDPLTDIAKARQFVQDRLFPIEEIGAAIRRALISDGEIAVVIHPGAADFSVIEAHIISTLVHESGSVTLCLPPEGGELRGHFDFPVYMEREIAKPNLKQNGRSADYLKHGGHYGNAAKRPR